MSRRKRTSWISTGRSIRAPLKLLRELDSVPVRVVDVQQPHLALELEDDADVDAARAQAGGLRLQVRDVDVRHGAVRLRLALREPDLHPAAPEVRPALREVDGDLLEPERLAVEPSPLVEVADVVPDGRYSGHVAGSLTTARGPGPRGTT